MNAPKSDPAAAHRDGRFRDRAEAGRRLAAALAGFAGQPVVVLALPRGGVPVGYEIARALAAPLDLVLVRKIGVPGQPEFAMGAIAEGTPPVTLRNEPVLAGLKIGDGDFARVRARELVELERRREAYRGDRPTVDVAGRIAILVDDGIATGMTARAAAEAVRARGATRVVIATPVAAGDAAAALRREFGTVVCLAEPRDLVAVGGHYQDFHPVDDDEVRALLAGPAGSRPG